MRLGKKVFLLRKVTPTFSHMLLLPFPNMLLLLLTFLVAAVAPHTNDLRLVLLFSTAAKHNC